MLFQIALQIVLVLSFSLNILYKLLLLLRSIPPQRIGFLCEVERLPFESVVGKNCDNEKINLILLKGQHDHPCSLYVLFWLCLMFDWSGLGFTCGKVIGDKWEKYLKLLQAEYEPG